MKEIEKTISEVNKVFKRYVEKVPFHSFKYKSPKGQGWITYKLSVKNTALKTICKSETVMSDSIITNAKNIMNHLSYCSQPKGFKVAWDLNTDSLGFHEKVLIINEGGQLIESGNFNGSSIFKSSQKGIILGPNQIPLLALTHIPGNYEDELNELGMFTYQADTTITGMLRFRYFEFLSKMGNIPVVILVAMSFQSELPHQNVHNSKPKKSYIIVPTELIHVPEISDILSVDRLSAPLKLRALNTQSALNKLEHILSLDTERIDIKIRKDLPRVLVTEFNYESIAKKNSKKGKAIKEWAQQNGYCCPGNLCNGAAFNKIKKLSDISFGHIVSQDWARAFNYLKYVNSHPDNLYLTCKRCNSSLGANFPDFLLRKKILANGTIGDWLRQHEKEIKNLL